MTQLLVESFGTYGSIQAGTVPTDMRAAMLSGAWASISSNFTGESQGLPWTTVENEAYFAVGYFTYSPTDFYMRRVIPTAADELIFSFRLALANLPTNDNVAGLIGFRNGANQTLFWLVAQSNGTLVLRDSTPTTVGSTQNPVVVSQATHHYEMRLKVTTGVFKLYIDGTLVMDLSGIATGNAGPIGQLAFLSNLDSIMVSGTIGYLTDLIVRNTLGSYNNTIMGDRRVATLMVNSDDVAHQGWTKRPIQRFGTGVLAHPTGTTGGVSCAATADTSLGSGDFTIESQVRFMALPTGTQTAHIAGKWQGDNNNRSWRLYKAGPAVDNGMLVFQISTDGTAGTLNQLLTWPWTPSIGQWYHVAISRAAGQIRLFIDGVIQGIAVADANTYFAANAVTSLMTQRDNSGPVASTFMLGWLDEFRLTKGVGRYTTNFTPPSAAFPRGGGDPNWASVTWLSGFDAGILDESSFARTLSTFGVNVPTAAQPGDLASAYLSLNKRTPPYEQSFIEAALVPATGMLTLTNNPANTETVTVGTKNGSTPAVYTFKTALSTAFDVLIGANMAASLNNLVAAILKSAGEGTTYGTGTTANWDVTAAKMPTPQVQVTAIVAGAAGNSIASTETLANGSWGATTLQGGANIPPFSQFGFERPPNKTTIIDSVTLVQRAWKTDSGPATLQQSFVAPAGAVANGASYAMTTSPTLYFDTFEVDPDTSGPLTPTTIINGKVKINRTA